MTQAQVFQKAAEEHQEFLRSIGQLTLAWSTLETVLYKLLKRYAGVTDGVGRALFSGTRASAALKVIDAIADNEAMEMARRSDLTEIFGQVKAINTMRDFVVHHVDGSEQEFEAENPSERVLSDSVRASRFAKVKSVYVGSATLEAMRVDCLECCWRLHAHLDRTNTPFKPGPGTNGIRNPWRFKPPQPKVAKPRRPR